MGNASNKTWEQLTGEERIAYRKMCAELEYSAYLAYQQSGRLSAWVGKNVPHFGETIETRKLMCLNKEAEDAHAAWVEAINRYKTTVYA